MFCVCETFVTEHGESRVSFSHIYSDEFFARLHARIRRRSLNDRWIVEVCEVKIISARLVEK